MGRKSRADTRREEILAAFERCIGRYGIDAPLERIAEEAGVQRSLIRHYLGNRDELVDQIVERIAEAYPQRVAAALEPALAQGAAGVLDVFFSDALNDNAWDDVIHAVVSAAQGRYPRARQRVAAMLVALVERIAEALARLFPTATPEARYEAAYGLLCLAQSNLELRWLGLDPRHTAMARAGAERLLAALA
ncbi:MAG TPA: TetR/AcrR family transcriptional regulator [Chloroflexaceae bacterium]|nr:TetR/AcrR family transcriptional regulator [Chloroflexaceae bacterium]